MSSILDKLKDKLIHFINDNDDSNLVKKLKLVTEEIEEVKLAFEDTEKIKDLAQAYGKNLDHYGSNVGEARRGNEDKLYRLLIRIKIAENTSDATIDYVVQALAMALDRPVEDIYIREGWDFIDETQPAALYTSFPAEVFQDYNITYDRFIELFNNVIGAGISTDFFVLEEDSINVVATMPYTEFSTIPFADTIRTGEWTDQATAQLIETIFQEEYSTQEQELPFIGGFFSDDENNLDYPDATKDQMNVNENYINQKSSLPFAYTIKVGQWTSQTIAEIYVTDLITSLSHHLHSYNFVDQFYCGEVRL